MNSRIKFVLVFINAICIYANPVESTFLTRSSMEFRYDIGDKVRFDFSPQLHYDFSNNNVKWIVFDTDINYRFISNFKISTSYRNKTRSDSKQHSLYGSFYYQTNRDPINLKFRFRYNNKIRFSKVKDNLSRKRDEEHLRGRLLLEYTPIHNLKPFLGAEIFFLINDDKYPSGFDIFRYYFGTEIKLGKKHSIDIAWIYEEVFDLGKLAKENILNIKYTFDIN